MVVVVFLLVAVDPSGQVQVFFTPYIGTQLYSIFEWVSQGFASRHPFLTPYTYTGIQLYIYSNGAVKGSHPDILM